MDSNFQHQQQGEEVVCLSGTKEEVSLSGTEEEVLLEGTLSDVVLDTLPKQVPTKVIEELKEPCAPQNATSAVWRYFSLRSIGDCRKSICLFCSKEVFFNGTVELSTLISNLKIACFVVSGF